MSADDMDNDTEAGEIWVANYDEWQEFQRWKKARAEVVERDLWLWEHHHDFSRLLTRDGEKWRRRDGGSRTYPTISAAIDAEIASRIYPRKT
jgi:hypothetical protein